MILLPPCLQGSLIHFSCDAEWQLPRMTKDAGILKSANLPKQCAASSVTEAWHWCATSRTRPQAHRTWVGHADDRDGLHCGVGRNNVLHLDRCDVRAAADNNVLQPAREVK